MPEIKKKFRAACESSGCNKDEIFYGTQVECLRLAKTDGWLIAKDYRLCPACHLLERKAQSNGLDRLCDLILKSNSTSEYKQAAVILIRNVWSDFQKGEKS